MPTLNEISPVTINLETVYPSVRGFARQAHVCDFTDVLPGVRARKYAEASELVADGFPTTHRAYRAAQRIFQQKPRPADFILANRYLPTTQVVKFTPLNVTVGYEYTFTVVDNVGVETSISYVVETGDVDDDIAAALATALGPVADMAAVAALAVVTCTSTAGKLIRYKDLPPVSDLKVEVTTADPGIATDLAAIDLYVQTADDLAFFGFSLDSCGEAECNAARAWAEGTSYVFAGQISDSLAADSGTTSDAFSDAKAAASSRCILLYSQSDTGDLKDAAFLAAYLSRNVPEGSAGPAFKTLRGCTPDRLTSAQDSAIRAKNGTTYTTLNSTPITFEGHTPDGDWFDTTVNATVLQARIQEAIFGAQVNAKKIPYTQKGIDTVAGIAQAVLDRHVGYGMLAPLDDDGEAPSVTAPKRSEVTAAQRAARTLPNLVIRAQFAGAIHRTQFVAYLGV